MIQHEPLRYDTIKEKYAERMAALMALCFPRIAPDDLLTADEFRYHAELFPEGQIVALSGNEVVGLGVGLFVLVDWDNFPATEHEMVGDGHYANHRMDGDYYYGMGICVHPGYRRRGIARKVYELRQNLVRRYNKKGILAAGVLNEFPAHKASMSAHEYVDKVLAGELYDATLTTQLHNGFEVRDVVHGFFEDYETDSWSSLIVWRNPEYESNQNQSVFAHHS